MRTFAICLVLCAGSAGSAALGGCTSGPPPMPRYRTTPGSVQAAAAPATQTVFAFEVGDEVEVSVWKEADLTTQQKILTDGTISPKLLKPISIAGLSIADTQDRLAKAYTEFVKDPKVSVKVVSSRADRVFVIGEVRTPQAVALNGPMQVLESVTLAGGFIEESASKPNIRVVRRASCGTPDVIRVDGEAILNGRASDFALQRGDIIFVPAKGITKWSRAFGQALTPVAALVGTAGSLATVAIAVDQVK